MSDHHGYEHVGHSRPHDHGHGDDRPHDASVGGHDRRESVHRGYHGNDHYDRDCEMGLYGEGCHESGRHASVLDDCHGHERRESGHHGYGHAQNPSNANRASRGHVRLQLPAHLSGNGSENDPMWVQNKVTSESIWSMLWLSLT